MIILYYCLYYSYVRYTNIIRAYLRSCTEKWLFSLGRRSIRRVLYFHCFFFDTYSRFLFYKNRSNIICCKSIYIQTVLILDDFVFQSSPIVYIVTRVRARKSFNKSFSAHKSFDTSIVNFIVKRKFVYLKKLYLIWRFMGETDLFIHSVNTVKCKLCYTKLDNYISWKIYDILFVSSIPAGLFIEVPRFMMNYQKWK